ncbi:hypothetical protein R1flu_001483 [Riccia fluitans]|uniref:Uncharacterized protein n=1 Tax=Riccia fluitans TaxID=41844 RepID=A0ABD1Y3E7_9MARC
MLEAQQELQLLHRQGRGISESYRSNFRNHGFEAAKLYWRCGLLTQPSGTELSSTSSFTWIQGRDRRPLFITEISVNLCDPLIAQHEIHLGTAGIASNVSSKVL